MCICELPKLVNNTTVASNVNTRKEEHDNKISTDEKLQQEDED